MSSWEYRKTVEAPFAADAPLERLVDFYRANGYELREGEPDPSSIDDDSTPPHSVSLSRGREGAGWWSSDMTDLAAHVTLTHVPEDASPLDSTDPETPDGGFVRITYEVDTSGQYLTEADRRVWRREVRTASAHLEHPSDAPRDLRPMEEKRAERMERSRFRYAIWGAVAAFLLVVVLRILGLV